MLILVLVPHKAFQGTVRPAHYRILFVEFI